MAREETSRKAKHILFFILFFMSLGLALTVVSTGYTGTSEGKVQSDDRQAYMVYGVELPTRVTFAGEPVPMDLFDVLESMDRELLSNTYFHSQTIRLIKM